MNLGLSTNQIEISNFLAKCAERSKDNTYNVQSLRIAARTFESAGGNIPKELLKQNFPRFFNEIIDKACKEFDLPY